MTPAGGSAASGRSQPALPAPDALCRSGRAVSPSPVGMGRSARNRRRATPLRSCPAPRPRPSLPVAGEASEAAAPPAPSREWWRSSGDLPRAAGGGGVCGGTVGGFAFRPGHGFAAVLRAEDGRLRDRAQRLGGHHAGKKRAGRPACRVGVGERPRPLRERGAPARCPGRCRSAPALQGARGSRGGWAQGPPLFSAVPSCSDAGPAGRGSGGLATLLPGAPATPRRPCPASPCRCSWASFSTSTPLS